MSFNIRRFGKALLVLALFFLFGSYKASAQIVVGELNGSYPVIIKKKTQRMHFRGYIFLLDMSSHKFQPVVTNNLQNPCGTPHAAPLEPVYEWAQVHNAFLVFNGNFMEPESEYKPGDCQAIVGPVKNDGMLVSPLEKRPDRLGNPSLTFSKSGQPEITMLTRRNLQKAFYVVSGQYRPHANVPTNGTLLIQDGVIKGNTALPVPEEPAPRTAVGVTKNRQFLIAVMIEGRLPGIQGITLPYLAELLKSFGAYNAVNFDGGGSSSVSYVPSPDLPVHESLKMYKRIRNSHQNNLDKRLLFQFIQRDPRIPLANHAANKVPGYNPNYPNRFYRPVNIHWGFKIVK